MSTVRHAKPGILARLTRKQPPVTAVGLPRRVAGRESAAAGLRARDWLTTRRDIPATLLPALRDWNPNPVAALQDYADEPVMPYWNPGERTVTVDLAGVDPGEQWTAPRSAFVADLTELPHFRATCKTRGWCGLAMRRDGTS